MICSPLLDLSTDDIFVVDHCKILSRHQTFWLTIFNVGKIGGNLKTFYIIFYTLIDSQVNCELRLDVMECFRANNILNAAP